jgi:hypothetical protein
MPRTAGRQLAADAPARSITEVGIGDYIKIADGSWVRIAYNSAFGAGSTPRTWIVRSEHGGVFTMYQILRYAKAADFE